MFQEIIEWKAIVVHRLIWRITLYALFAYDKYLIKLHMYKRRLIINMYYGISVFITYILF